MASSQYRRSYERPAWRARRSVTGSRRFGRERGRPARGRPPPRWGHGGVEDEVEAGARRRAAVLASAARATRRPSAPRSTTCPGSNEYPSSRGSNTIRSARRGIALRLRRAVEALDADLQPLDLERRGVSRAGPSRRRAPPRCGSACSAWSRTRTEAAGEETTIRQDAMAASLLRTGRDSVERHPAGHDAEPGPRGRREAGAARERRARPASRRPSGRGAPMPAPIAAEVPPIRRPPRRDCRRSRRRTRSARDRRRSANPMATPRARPITRPRSHCRFFPVTSSSRVTLSRGQPQLVGAEGRRAVGNERDRPGVGAASVPLIQSPGAACVRTRTRTPDRQLERRGLGLRPRSSVASSREPGDEQQSLVSCHPPDSGR